MDPREYARGHREQFLDDLRTLLCIPSISTLPQHRPDIDRAAQWLLARLRDAGLQSRMLSHDGLPIVYGEWLGAPGRPTLLCYGHYDVQPPDPLDAWTSPPFEPTIRDDFIYARGASDDKGQVLLQLHALESLLRATGRLPVNVKVFFEGEEEIGSPSVLGAVPAYRELLAADALLACDGMFFARELPSLLTGLRGLLYTEVDARGAGTDLHSGQFGGAAPNPLEALARIIAGLKTRRGRVAIPGFYARVRPPSAAERGQWARLPFDERDYLAQLGTDAAPGEEGYSVLERRWVRPTLEVHGIGGGFVGPGTKTVIPAQASAKVSMRLVPEQRPEPIFRAFEARVRRLTPPGVRTAVRALSMAEPVAVAVDAPAVQAAAAAVEDVFGTRPVFVRAGGTGPVVIEFVKTLGVAAVLLGFGLPGDRHHAPNERFYLPNFYRGIDAVIAFMQRLGGA